MSPAPSAVRKVVAWGALLLACCGKSPLDGEPTGEPGNCDDWTSENPALQGTSAGELSNRQPPCEFCTPPPPTVYGGAAILPEPPTLTRVSGGRAYVALPHGLLSVVDVGVPESPRVLGQHRFRGRPVHLEVDGTRAVVVVGEGAYTPIGEPPQSSRLLVVETSEPTDLRVIAEEPLAGVVTGVFRTGPFLLVATQGEESSLLESIDLSDPTAPRRADSLELPYVLTPTEHFLPSFAFRGDHVFVAEPSTNDGGANTIIHRVVPDASGILERLAQAEMAGAVPGPGGIDETGAALSLITVEAGQSFVQVLDSENLEAIARHEVSGFQVTLSGGHVFSFEGVSEDLFRLRVTDLSSPEAPSTATVEIPGLPFNTSLKPLADRLLVSHYLEENSSTPALSQYDLGTLELTGRVEWPGELSDPRLDVFESADLAIVAYRDVVGPSGLCDPWGAALRFVQLTDGDLTLGGAVPAHEAIHDLHDGPPLLLASGRGLSLIDATDPSEPRIEGEVRLSASVGLSTMAGSRIARVGTYDTTGTPYLDVVETSQADWPAQSLVEIGTIEGDPGCSWGVNHLFATEDRVFALRDEEVLDRNNETSRRVLVSFDASGSGAPTPLWASDFPVVERNEPNDSSVIGWTGSAIVSMTTINTDISGPPLIDILDVSDPTGARHTSLELPENTASAALVDSTIFFTRVEELGGERLKYYLERVDVAEPTEPSWLPAAVIPGAAIAYDPSTERTLVGEVERETLEGVTLAECIERFGWYARFQAATSPMAGLCSRHRNALSVVSVGAACPSLEDRQQLDEAYLIETSANQRVFAALLVRGAESRPDALLIARWSDGTLDPTVTELPEGDYWSLAMHESWVLVLSAGRIAIFDAERPAAPPRIVELPGEQIHNVAFSTDSALISLGEDGLYVLPLTDG